MLKRDDNMAYVGAKPWHGLGTEVSGDLTPEQMLEAAGLGWRVLQYPLLVQGRKETRSVKSHVALVRSSDGKVLDIASTDYKPVQNVELFRFFRQYTDAGEMQMHTAGSLDGGRIVWALAKMQGEFTLPGTNDKTEIELLQPKLFADVVEASMGRPSSLHPVTPGKVDGARVLDAILSRDAYRFDPADFSPTTRTVLDSIERRQPGARETAGTAWGAFNGVTYWVDHLRGDSRDTGLQAAWYGPGVQTKSDALDLALDYADRLEALRAA